jgi:predicted component of type VI protein secretion system
MAELIVQSGKHQGKKLKLPADAEVLIGRDEKCQIRLASSDVSRHHCAIRQTPEGLIARDLGSRNGTYLNEVLMEDEVLLQPGDRLRIGPIVFQVPGAKMELPTSPTSATSPEPPASDDDIAAWLSSESIRAPDGLVAGSGDTTVIPKLPPADHDSAEHPTVPKEIPHKEPLHKDAAHPREPQRQFRNIAEEAADIIRRHWELVKAEEEEE